MGHFWDDLKEGFLNFIFPLTCQNCGKEIKESKGYAICQDCMNQIKLINFPYCYRCGKPLSNQVSFEEKALCADCYNKKNPFYYTRSVAYYEGVIRKSIHLLKYKKQVKLVEPLGNLLIDYLKGNSFMNIDEIDIILPVPLSRKDYIKRGFNQSSLLGKCVADYFSISFAENRLTKEVNNLSQVGLSKKDRRDNVRHVYSLKHSFPDSVGNNILLIDDIYTTGATVEACCKELKKTSAQNLFVLTLARGI